MFPYSWKLLAATCVQFVNCVFEKIIRRAKGAMILWYCLFNNLAWNLVTYGWMFECLLLAALHCTTCTEVTHRECCTVVEEKKNLSFKSYCVFRPVCFYLQRFFIQSLLKRLLTWFTVLLESWFAESHFPYIFIF